MFRREVNLASAAEKAGLSSAGLCCGRGLPAIAFIRFTDAGFVRLWTVEAIAAAGMAADPISICVVGWVPGSWHVQPVDNSGFHWDDRAPHKPPVNFRMTIAKGKTAGPVVVRGWRVAPTGGHALRGLSSIEVAIVDAIGMFVEEDKNLGELGNAAHFEVLRPAGIGPINALVGDIDSGTGRPVHTIGARRKMTEKGVHGITPSPSAKSRRDLLGT